jgi:heme oxygenase (biliverdin-IX-beta and delta-forming)
MRFEKSQWTGRAQVSLRANTPALHELLDGRLNSSNLGKLPVYIEYLQTNWPIASIEPALTDAGIQRLLPDWHQRQRHLALVADLEELGVCGGPSWNCVVGADTGTLLGWAYVLEGSRLGARLIHQIVEASAGRDLLKATRFIRHGEDGNYWKTFTAALSQIDRDDNAIASAGVAARTAFECFLGAARGFHSPKL